jgi:kynurenine formamidase
VRFAGGETIAFEVIRPDTGHTALPVHRRLLLEAGTHLIETMNLAPLPADGIGEFVFVLAPLRLRGATGAPARPLALVARR